MGSMTREEATVQIYGLKKYCEDMADSDESGSYVFDLDVQALDLALSALRPVSRGQVEKMWRGEWMALDECSNEGVYCKRCKKKVYRIEYANEKMRSPFCPACGAAQTDEAVEMVMERLEALKDGSTPD